MLRADLTRIDAADRGAADAVVTPDDPRWAERQAGTTSWGDVLSPQSIRRLLCDAAVSGVVLVGASQVLDVGRATRDWSEPQRRAINVRDGACRGPHCTRPIAWTSVHHLIWWRDNGVTSVDNGIALCHHCHRLVHDDGWTIDFDPLTADAAWRSPDGHTVTTHARAGGPPPAATQPPSPAGSGPPDSGTCPSTRSPRRTSRSPGLDPVGPDQVVLPTRGPP